METTKRPQLIAVGFWPRFVARLVDAVVLSPLFLLTYSVFEDRTARHLVVVAIGGVYEVILTTAWGQTVGKRVMQVRVVRFPSGERLALAKPVGLIAAIRWFVPVSMSLVSYALPALSPILGLWVIAIYIPIFRGPNYRGVPDMAAGTYVVRAD